MTKVEVFTAPGCGKCGKAKDELAVIVDRLGGEK